MGLNDSYSVIIGNILLTTPFPLIMQAFNIVSQEETHRSFSSISTFIVKNPIKSKVKHLNLKCSLRGGLGYLVEK